MLRIAHTLHRLYYYFSRLASGNAGDSIREERRCLAGLPSTSR